MKRTLLGLLSGAVVVASYATFARADNAPALNYGQMRGALQAHTSENPTLTQVASIESYSVEQQKADWRNAEKRMAEIRASNLSEEEKCQKNWDVIWPLEKAGNLEAIYADFQASALGSIAIQGIPEDRLTRIRYGTVFMFYVLGSSRHNEEMKYSSPEIYWKIASENSPVIANNTRLKKCMLEEMSQVCTDIAVQEKLIPSFAQYAAEIDMYLANGAKVQCSDYRSRGAENK